MTDNLRGARQADFDSRANFASEDVYRHRSHNWRYIPIHPFSDESDVLARLKMSPTSCGAVDAWWEINGDATLIQSYTTGYSASHSAGLYAQLTECELCYTYLTAVVATEQIDRTTFEAAMLRFAELGFSDWNIGLEGERSICLFNGQI